MNKLIYIQAFAILLFLTSCEDVIDVKINDADKSFYVVEAKVTTDENPSVFLTKTIPVTVDEAPKTVSGAIVRIKDNSNPPNEITLIEDNDTLGYYKAAPSDMFLGAINKSYTLNIETPDGTKLTATETLLQINPIDSIEVRPSKRGDFMFLGIFNYGSDSAGVRDFYKWDIFVNNTPLPNNILVANDDFIDGGENLEYEIFTDFHNPTDDSERKLKYGDTIFVKQMSISKFVYKFYYQVLNQSQTGFLFSVPPANIKGNITASDGKKVFGIFSAHDVSVSNQVIINDSIESLLVKP